MHVCVQSHHVDQEIISWLLKWTRDKGAGFFGSFISGSLGDQISAHAAGGPADSQLSRNENPVWTWISCGWRSLPSSLRNRQLSRPFSITRHGGSTSVHERSGSVHERSTFSRGPPLPMAGFIERWTIGNWKLVHSLVISAWTFDIAVRPRWFISSYQPAYVSCTAKRKKICLLHSSVRFSLPCLGALRACHLFSAQVCQNTPRNSQIARETHLKTHLFPRKTRMNTLKHRKFYPLPLVAQKAYQGRTDRVGLSRQCLTATAEVSRQGGPSFSTFLRRKSLQ